MILLTISIVYLTYLIPILLAAEPIGARASAGGAIILIICEVSSATNPPTNHTSTHRILCHISSFGSSYSDQMKSHGYTKPLTVTTMLDPTSLLLLSSNANWTVPAYLVAARTETALYLNSITKRTSLMLQTCLKLLLCTTVSWYPSCKHPSLC
jgi:hypothetical protein